MAVSQEDLTVAAVAGDEEALGELLARHSPELRQWLDRQIGRQYRSSFSVEDVMQVTFFEAFLRIRQFEPRGAGSFRAWLWQLGKRNLQDAIKHLNREKRPPPGRRVGAAPEDDAHTALLDRLEASGTTPTKGAARAEAIAILEEALAKLPEDYAQVVRIFDLEGRSAAETAERMGRTPAAVYMLKARAYDRLAELLGGSTNFFSRGS